MTCSTDFLALTAAGDNVSVGWSAAYGGADPCIGDLSCPCFMLLQNTPSREQP